MEIQLNDYIRDFTKKQRVSRLGRALREVGLYYTYFRVNYLA